MNKKSLRSFSSELIGHIPQHGVILRIIVRWPVVSKIDLIFRGMVNWDFDNWNDAGHYVVLHHCVCSRLVLVGYVGVILLRLCIVSVPFYVFGSCLPVLPIFH